MGFVVLARLPLPNSFASPEQQQIRGLNYETIATVDFPPPAWLNHSEYTALQATPDDDHAHSALFSLNLSIYDQSIKPQDWDDTYFFLYGLVHPYALTWEIGPDNSSDGDHDTQNYTIPAMIVRDLCYQP